MHIQNKHIVLYDGDCPMCNYWVNFILKRDDKNKFMFAALQSDFGQDFLKKKPESHRIQYNLPVKTSAILSGKI
jgi:predicted DCC family thiol-disulfide oxidoreductase YuxK